MRPLDGYAIMYMAGLAIALFAPIIVLLIVATLRLRDYREPRDPIRRVQNIERGRRAQSDAMRNHHRGCTGAGARISGDVTGGAGSH